MIGTLLRLPSSSKCTQGALMLLDKFFCWTLEDIVRDIKIANISAIPAGQYEVIINESIRFKRQMPLLLNVPNFTGIRIHDGATAANTDGCILIGYNAGKDFLIDNKKAFNDFFYFLSNILKYEKFFIDIKNGL